VLVLPGTDLSGAARVSDRIRRALVERLILTTDGERMPVTASFGVAAFPEATTADALLAAADGAL